VVQTSRIVSHGSRWGFESRRIGFVALIALGFARPARAQTTLEPVDLRYRAPESCPSFSQFLAEVQRSTARLRLAGGAEPARHFDVVVEADGRAGHLILEGGSKGERDVSGVDCTEVAGLLAFATALAADPDAQPPDAPTSVAAFPTPRPAPVTPVPKLAPAPIVTTERGLAPPAAQRTPRVSGRNKWSVAALGFATGASTPAVTWGAGVFGELELSAVTLAPRVRLGARYSNKTLDVTPGNVSLTNELVTLEPCSGALHYSSLSFLLCLRAQGGVRIAAGHDLPDARSQRRPVLDLGAAAHLRWRFAGVAFFELGGALLFPTVHDTVVIQRGATVYPVPGVGGLGEFALGVEFGDQPPG
jgi:hypothetical protein